MAPVTLGHYEFAILVTVSRLGDAAYGASVRREVSQRLRRQQSVGAVYATLQRLEDKGLLRSWMSDPEPVRGGRSKRHFRVTAAGALALKGPLETAGRLVAEKPPRWRPA
jgi:DNA-binding PadR family transcriptional regulator